MPNSLINKTNIFLTLVIGVLFGFWCLAFLPIVSRNLYFLISVLLLFVFIIALLINVNVALTALFIARASLDPLFNYSKVNILGENIGMGGVLNFCIIIIAGLFMIRDPKRIAGNPVNKWWLWFLAVSGVSVIYSPTPGIALKVFGQLLSYAAMAVIPFYMIRDINDKRFWIKVLFFSSFLHIVFANIDLFHHGQIYADAGWRIKGTFSHPNVLAFYLMFMIMLVFYMLKSGLFSLTRTKTNLLILYMLNLFILFVATKTRSAWIACVVLFSTYGVFKERKYLMMSFILPCLLLLMPFTRERIATAFATGVGGNNSLLWRIQLWLSTIHNIREGFLFGKGLASFEYFSINFNSLTRTVAGSPAHNTYLEVLFETGIIGLVSFVGIFISMLRSFYRKVKGAVQALSREYAIVFAYVVSYMVLCFSDNMRHYLAFNWYFWFFIGVMLTPITDGSEGKDG